MIAAMNISQVRDVVTSFDELPEFHAYRNDTHDAWLLYVIWHDQAAVVASHRGGIKPREFKALESLALFVEIHSHTMSPDVSPQIIVNFDSWCGA